MTSSLRRTDILALSNLRNDGRKAEEIRRMRIQMGALAGKEIGGSALVEMGLTVALATVCGPVECTRRSDELPDRYECVLYFLVALLGSSSPHTPLPNSLKTELVWMLLSNRHPLLLRRIVEFPILERIVVS